MSKAIRALIITFVVVCLLVGFWVVVWILPDVPTKSIRGYFSAIMDQDYQKAWSYIYPNSEFMRDRGGPTMSFEKFRDDLTNARSHGTKITEFKILKVYEQQDPLAKITAQIVRIQTENIVSGNPKTSDPKDYYLRKDKDGVWKIYKGQIPKE